MRIYKGQVRKFFSQTTTLGEALMKITPLTPKELGDVASKGGVWIQKQGKGKIKRIRVLKETVFPDDVLYVNYDSKVLALPEIQHLDCVYEDHNYGIWVKPAGVVPQGSETSDHASVLRYVEKIKNKEVYLVHRLDRETLGLMIVAYHSKAAGLLSALFQRHEIKKSYRAIVLGKMMEGHRETITASLDDKEAITHLEVLSSGEKTSLLQVRIETGRFHQIRRHLDHIGHPIMGDPKYGKGNKNKEGLMLVADKLSFIDPWSKRLQEFSLDLSLAPHFLASKI
jgi:tRNA pseudouridine32 synthase/23S rRNA pseudouridine746 synthase